MDINLLGEAVNLTIFGMGFVFVFLIVMVVITTLMSQIILKIQTITQATESINNSSFEIDKKTRSIIEAAIKMHLKR